MRCELTCDQAVLLSFFCFRGEGKRTPFFFSPFTKKKPDLGLGMNGLKKKRKGKE